MSDSIIRTSQPLATGYRDRRLPFLPKLSFQMEAAQLGLSIGSAPASRPQAVSLGAFAKKGSVLETIPQPEGTRSSERLYSCSEAADLEDIASLSQSSRTNMGSSWRLMLESRAGVHAHAAKEQRGQQGSLACSWPQVRWSAHFLRSTGSTTGRRRTASPASTPTAALPAGAEPTEACR